jgi:hypothetical protein
MGDSLLRKAFLLKFYQNEEGNFNSLIYFSHNPALLRGVSYVEVQGYVRPFICTKICFCRIYCACRKATLVKYTCTKHASFLG